MSIPLFPKLKPKLLDPSWFDVDQPCDHEDEISQLEATHKAWLQSISQRDADLIPIGKRISEESCYWGQNLDEDDDEEDEDDNDDDDDDSESHDEEEEDEIGMDVAQDGSPVF